MKCAVCKKGERVPALIELTDTVDGHVFTASVHGEKCPECGEDFTPVTELERFELAVARALSAAPATGQAVRYMRKALGLKGVELAELLGVTPETVSRWEADKHPIDRGSWALLGLLAADRAAGTWTTENALKSAAKARPLAPRVELKVA